MAKKNKHVHRYQLRDYGKRKVYACTLPDCTHFHYPDMVRGKISLCNQCGQEFILTNDIVTEKTVRPRCKDCRAAKKLGGPKKASTKKINEHKLDIALDSLWNSLKGI